MKNINKTNKIIMSVLVLCILIVVGYIYNNNVTPENANPIKIGGIFSQTGFGNRFGEQSTRGTLLAAEEINNNGGINGRKIELSIEDDGTDPKNAVGLYKKLTSLNNVDVILGSNFDFVVNPLFAEAAKGDTVVITPTSPRIAGAMDTSKYTFTMLSDFSAIVYNLQNYLNKTPYQKAAVIHYQSAFGKEIFKVVDDMSKKNGKPNTTEVIYNSLGLKDWTVYILKLKKENADIVFVDMLAPDYLNFAKQAKRLGFNAQLIAYNDIYSELKPENYEVLNNIVVLNWDVLSYNKIFAERFEAKYGEKPEKSAAESYLAVYVAAQATADANGDKGKIPEILGAKTFNSPLASFKFDKNHAAAITNVKIQQIQMGQIVDLESY